MSPRFLSREAAREFYDRFGARQDSQEFYERPAVPGLIARLDLARARAVVELGCGTGRLAAELLDTHLAADARYVGLDVSGTMVELARDLTARFNRRVEIRQTDGSPRIDAPDGSFDRFISSYVLDLLSPDDIASVLGEAHRVLAPGAMNVPFWRLLGSRPDVPARPAEPIVVCCERGPRAEIAWVALRIAGFSTVLVLEGHMARWRTDRLPQDYG